MASSGGKDASTRPGAPRRLNVGGGRRMAIGAFGLGLVLVTGLAAMPDYGRSVVPGRMVPGHEGLACTKCHAPAPGSFRQQVRANLLHWTGFRATGASFGHEPVAAASCSGCHARDNDRHPGFRFREPRFSQINKTLDARNCLTCHSEHAATRVANDGMFCVACHEGMTARKEVIQPTHAELSAGKRWESCLTCHDFHGNHPGKAPHRFDQAHDLGAVRAYLANGADPYASKKIQPARDPAAGAETRREAEARVP